MIATVVRSWCVLRAHLGNGALRVPRDRVTVKDLGLIPVCGALRPTSARHRKHP